MSECGGSVFRTRHVRVAAGGKPFGRKSGRSERLIVRVRVFVVCSRKGHSVSVLVLLVFVAVTVFVGVMVMLMLMVVVVAVDGVS